MNERKSVLQSNKTNIQESFKSFNSIDNLNEEYLSCADGRVVFTPGEVGKEKLLDKNILQSSSNIIQSSVDNDTNVQKDYKNYWKRRVYYNNIILSSALNLAIALLMIFVSVSSHWYTLYNITTQQTKKVGLLYYHLSFQNELNYGFLEEPGVIISGSITFFIIWCGIIQQIYFLYMQLQLITRSENSQQFRAYKKTRFKTLVKTIFYTYLFGLIYWVILTGLNNINSQDTNKFGEWKPAYSFYVALGGTFGFIPIYFYFKYYKEKLRQHIVANQVGQR